MNNLELAFNGIPNDPAFDLASLFEPSFDLATLFRQPAHQTAFDLATLFSTQSPNPPPEQLDPFALPDVEESGPYSFRSIHEQI